MSSCVEGSIITITCSYVTDKVTKVQRLNKPAYGDTASVGQRWGSNSGSVAQQTVLLTLTASVAQPLQWETWD